MTTINTVEDLIRALDENPEWVEALRARLLTRELLEMPQTLAKLADTMSRQFEEQNKASADFRREVGNAFADFRQDMNAGFQAQREYTDEKVGELRQEMREGFQAQREYTEEKAGELRQEMDAGFRTIRRDMGVLKAGHTLTSVLRGTSAITDDMGLDWVRDLNYNDLRALTPTADTSDIPRNILLSFRKADLVMEARDSSGETCYVAVEVSYTANGRDTERAIRNAAFLTRFTGHPAHAAIAALYRDNRIEERIASGEVFWHQLELFELESD